MDEITIRSGRPGDARGIARLDVETWRATYAGILAAPFLVGLSMQRRELGWATVIEREPHVRPRGVDQGVVQVVGQLAHVAEHLRSMAREGARVGGGGSADPVHR